MILQLLVGNCGYKMHLINLMGTHDLLYDNTVRGIPYLKWVVVL